MKDKDKIVSTYKGERLCVTVFGASHAKRIGVTVTGLNKGESFDKTTLKEFMARRAAKKEDYSTKRLEPDEVLFLSGEKEGVITGKKLTAVIYNKVQNSNDYEKELTVPRPGHADYTGLMKFGKEFDHRGGGQFSGRMTAPICIIGGIAKQILEKKGITVNAFIEEIGKVKGKSYLDVDDEAFDFNLTDLNFPLIDYSVREKMEAEIKIASQDGDSIGGKIGCVIKGVPAGIGGVMFDSIESELSKVIFGIPAVKGIEFGSGFKLTEKRGSEANDAFIVKNGQVKTLTNNNGGINGGIANGMPITFSVAIKPTPSIYKEQDSVNLKTLENVKLKIKGRHDSCIAVRAVPVIEAAACIVLLDKLS